MENKKSKKTLIFAILGIVAIIILILFLLKGCTKEKEYTVIFDANGGSYVGNVTVKENETVKQPLNPTREGYQFVGWYLGEELFDFDTKITKDITLKAHWEANGITLNFTTLSLKVGDTKQLEITSFPTDVKIEDFLFESSDESILTVDEKGNLKALKAGTVTVTVKSKDGKYTKTCIVTVTEEEIEVESVTISGSSSVTVGSSIKLSVTLKPENATTKKLTWKSSNPSIATVDENGNVKGLKTGKVTITVTTENGKTATKDITVKAKSTSNPKPSNSPTPTTIDPTGVTIGGLTEVYVGKSIQLWATVSPDNATNKSVTWSSNNSGIATVDENGNVTGVSAGTVTITVTTANGKTATYEVTVKDQYIVYLTQRKLAVTEGAIQYDYKVEKNGIELNDYLGFTYNNTPVSRGQGSISSTAVVNGGNTASLKLASGEVVTASVVIN